jgi:NADPH:quinone reductase-like Zn-dependent oxidoreductase
MRVVGVKEFGGPEALQVFEVPEQHAGPGQVRIRVAAVAVNPTDTFIRNGAVPKMRGLDEPYYVPGMDAAGTIDEVGEGVEGFAVGDRVMAIVVPRGARGAYSESLVLPATSVAHSPRNASDVEAATLPMNGLTARLTLDLLALQPGQTLAVTGAAGAYGGYVVQLAKADGLRVIADASETDEQLVRDLGADEVVRRGDGVADRIRAIEPDGVDALADGSLQYDEVIPAVRDGGGFAVVRVYPGEGERDITIHHVMVSEYRHEQAKLDRLRQQAEDGAITLRVAGTFPAEQAAGAHRVLEAGGTRGRCVITF